MAKKTVTGACECGTCGFVATRPPTVRIVCHCTICQSFTGRPYSDVVIMPAASVTLGGGDQIAFRSYRRFRLPPPNLSRGKCRVCGRPVVEIGGAWPLKTYFLPAANFEGSTILPEPVAHTFYEHRQQDAIDGAGKHEGYWDSQKAIFGAIFQAFVADRA